MARRCSRLCVSCTSQCPVFARGEVLTAVHLCQLLPEPELVGDLGLRGQSLGCCWGFWLLLLPCCPGLKHKEMKSGPGQMGCGSGAKAQINMPQTVLTSRVMGRGASGASHVSRDSFALLHPYCVPSPVPSWALHGARHLPFCPSWDTQMGNEDQSWDFSPQVV